MMCVPLLMMQVLLLMMQVLLLTTTIMLRLRQQLCQKPHQSAEYAVLCHRAHLQVQLLLLTMVMILSLLKSLLVHLMLSKQAIFLLVFAPYLQLT
jgi:hypothetical protein